MKDISRVLFRHEPAAGLTGPNGEKRQARGLVYQGKGTDSQPAAGQRHQAGVVQTPLPVFTGWAEQAAPGDRLEQGSAVYRVLRVEDLCVGGTKVAARLLLEKEVAGDDCP